MGSTSNFVSHRYNIDVKISIVRKCLKESLLSGNSKNLKITIVLIEKDAS